MPTIQDKLIRWHKDNPENINYNDLHAFIMFRDQTSYAEFKPNRRFGYGFSKRLVDWINNIDEDKWQRELFNIIPNIMFIGEKEFDSLYRSAYRESVCRWIIEKENIDILSITVQAEMNNEIHQTWFCSATDSFKIADFCHINHIVENEYRPDWRSLAKLASSSQDIHAYILQENVRNIVILEDFVGSGSQFLGNKRHPGILKFIQTLKIDCNILLVPLLLCPKGQSNIQIEINNLKMNNRVSLKPVMSLPNELFITSNDRQRSPRVFDLIQKAHKIGKFKTHKHGYKNTGALIVMNSNCPNNSIPLIHEETPTWKPLFLRSSRS
jgi:hypothetical protein